MRYIQKKSIILKALIFCLTAAMLNQGVVVGASSARIYPAHKVIVYRGDQKVGVYTKEAPLPEGSIISTEDRCTVKLEDLLLVAEDQSVFSINTSGRHRNLFIKQGIIYFKTSGMRHTLTFITPDGQIFVQSIRLNAAFNDQSLKGYVAVSKNQSELGVVEGGSMDVFTDKGPVMIKSGKKIILSQAEMDIGLPEEEEPAKEEEETSKPKAGMSTGQKIAIGALGALALTGLAIGLGGGGGGGGSGGGDGDVSPSSP